MKRRLILLITTIILLAAFGALLHSPPGIDAITGATKRSKPVVVIADEPVYYYVGVAPGCPITADDIDAIAARNGELISLRLAIVEDDKDLLKQAQLLREQAAEGGVTLTIQEYSEVMLYSRAYHGKYDLLMIAANEPVMPDVHGAKFILYSQEE